MLRTLDIVSMALVLVALLFSVIAAETNGWLMTGMDTYGLFEVCDSVKCKELGKLSATLNAGIGCLSFSILTWGATFLIFFVSCYKHLMALRIAMLAFTSVSWVLTLTTSITFMLGWPAFVRSATAQWSYSFYLMWCAVALGTLALLLVIYMFLAPGKAVKGNNKGMVVVSVDGIVTNKPSVILGEMHIKQTGSDACANTTLSTPM